MDGQKNKHVGSGLMVKSIKSERINIILIVKLRIITAYTTETDK